MKQSQEFGPKATHQAVIRQWAFEGFTRISSSPERSGAATGGACDARARAAAVPLGNTGTTTGERA